MRFLFDAHHLGRRETGNETWTRNLATAMEDLVDDGTMEYAVTVAGAEELRELTLRPVHLVSSSSARRLALDLPRLVRATGSDAVLVTYTMPVTRVPSVVLVHDVSAWHPDSRDWLSPQIRLRYRTTVGLSCRRAAQVVASSEATARDLADRVGVPPHRLSVALGAVDMRLGSLLADTPSPPPDGVFRVLTVGNVVPRKNLLVLARAVAACRGAGSPMQLRIVGLVPREGEAIVAEIRELLGTDLDVAGYVPVPRLALEYRSADVVCVPSLLEGFGLPVLEAMQARVPVLVSDSSSLPEVVGDGGLVLGARDVAAWRDALLRLQADAGVGDELRRRGHRRAASFSWRRTAEIVLDRLQAAAGSPPA